MPTTREFLNAVLPADGLYCSVVIVDGKSRQTFYDSIDALAEAVLRADAALEGRGAVYHGCAAYTERSRKKSAVRALKSLWLDVDAGAAGYSDFPAALAAVEDFCGSVPLPQPVLVSSGRGLHVYWPFDRELSVSEWEPYAFGLKAKCNELGLFAGPERTADAASILRPPGTTHRKESPRRVICGPLRGPYGLQLFNHLGAESLGPGRSANHSRLNRPAFLNGHKPTKLIERLANVFLPEQIDFDALCEGCAQFRALRDVPASLNEPAWKACLGVLAFTSGGAEQAHAWCNDNGKYGALIDSKIAASARMPGPTGCAHFKGLNSLCAGCRFGNSTPLEAARTIAAERKVQTATSQPILTDHKWEGQDFEGHGLMWRDDALYFEADKQKLKILSFPFEIMSVHKGELKQDRTSYLIKSFKPHDGWKTWDMPASHLMGQNALPLLAEHGVVVHYADGFRKWVKEAVDVIHGKQKMDEQFEQFGWKENNCAFLYGDRLYQRGDVVPTALSGELRYRSQWLRPTQNGSRDQWRQAVDCLMGAGSEGQSFTVLASFAAPLMRFLDDNEGGAVVNLVTSASGRGKTTSLAAASSVWASNSEALDLTGIDTKNSRSAGLGVIANLPLTYDEFGNKDPGAVREFMVMFTSGRDKKRLDSSGQFIHNRGRWQTILISAGNRSLIDQIMSTGESDAPAMRILEFPVESSGDLKPSEAARLQRQLEENAGHAGDAYLKYLVKDGVLEAVKAKMTKLLDEIYVVGGFRREHRFRVRTLAAVGAAASIVEHLGLISFTPQRIMGWAVKHFAEGVAAPNDDRHIGVLSRFFNEHIGETLIMATSHERGVSQMPLGEKPRARCTVRIETRPDLIHVAEFELRQWIEKVGGGNYREVMAKLREDGVLVSEKQMQLTAGTELRSGVVRVVTFDSSHPKLTGELRLVRDSAVAQLTAREKEEAKIKRLHTVK